MGASPAGAVAWAGALGDGSEARERSGSPGSLLSPMQHKGADVSAHWPTALLWWPQCQGHWSQHGWQEQPTGRPELGTSCLPLPSSRDLSPHPHLTSTDLHCWGSLLSTPTPFGSQLHKGVLIPPRATAPKAVLAQLPLKHSQHIPGAPSHGFPPSPDPALSLPPPNPACSFPFCLTGSHLALVNPTASRGCWFQSELWHLTGGREEQGKSSETQMLPDIQLSRAAASQTPQGMDVCASVL